MTTNWHTFSDNKMTAEDLVPVAETVSAMAVSNRGGGVLSRTRNLARCLLLNMNYLGTNSKKIKSLFGELFTSRVEVKVAEFDFDAEHLSQM